MTIRGKQQTVTGTVLYMLADTLAAHSIGGFKCGFSRALRKCRHCLATHEQLSTKVCEFFCTYALYGKLLIAFV